MENARHVWVETVDVNVVIKVSPIGKVRKHLTSVRSVQKCVKKQRQTLKI